MSDVACLRLLGPLRVERAGEPICGFESRKALALLCYLAVQAKPVPRPFLADLFWTDKPEARGRANLSRVLHNLNSLLPDCLQADRQTIEFKPAAEIWLDLATFEKLAASQEPDSLARAVDLYGGDFMAGFYLDDSPEFDTWLLTEREHWRQRVAQLLRTLIDYHTRTQQYQPGQEFAARLLELNPWREEAHQQLMRLLALSGQRGAALAQYETCRRILAEELGVEPGEETKMLYECIRAGELSRREKLTHVPTSTHPERSLLPPAFAPLPSGSANPFVARERELAQLNDFLDQALAGQGQVVFITGEAGSGKTALMEEFTRHTQAVHVDLVVAGGNCNAHIGRGDPYLPFREILELLSGDLAAGASAGVSSAEHARRLEALAPDTIRTLLEISPELIDILVPGPALVSRAEAIGLDAVWLDPLRQRLARRQADQGQAGFTQHYLFEQYSRVLKALARQTPLLLALDDLQWADAGSLNLLFHLGRRLAGSRMLMVGAYRPTEVRLGRDGERHPLETVVNELQRHCGSAPIHLSQADNRRFVEALLDTEPNRLSLTFREALYRHTGGHALFTVEMLRGLQERGDLRQDEAGRWVAGPAINWQTLPARVEGVIGERLGRLPAALRESLQIASVAGEEFTAEVVAQVQGIEGREMIRQLSGVLDQQHRLVKGQGSRRLGSTSQHLSRYRFRHILFQKYLYDSLDEAERIYLHEAVGTTLERLYREQPREVALELARHFEAAGLPGQAIDYLRQAGERAERLSANEEALAHFKRALALLDTLPGTPARVEQELTLQLALGRVAMSARGYAAPEVEKALLRARALCQETHAEDSRQLFEALSGLCVVYNVRAEYEQGRELGEQLLELAQRAQKPIRLLWARQLLGEILVNMGEFLSARTHLEWDLAFYDPRRRVGRADHEVQDPAVSLLGKAAKVLWLLGYPDQALKKQQEALALARQLDRPFTLVWAFCTYLRLAEWRGDTWLVQAQVETAIRLCTEHGFPYWLAWITIWQGWALVEQCPAQREPLAPTLEGGRVEGRCSEPTEGQDPAEAGLAQIRQGLAAYLATGSEAGRPYYLAFLAKAYQQAGRVEEGLNVLAEALAIVNRTGERLYEAEIHRLKGELLLQVEAKVEAEACFWRAIEVARQQRAKSWELRATMSLSRLWQSQGKREEARQMLAEIYGWFTEGFDTVDLREAKALLESLARQ